MGVIFVELVIFISTGIILKMNSRLLNLSYLSTSIRFDKWKLNLNDKKNKEGDLDIIEQRQKWYPTHQSYDLYKIFSWCFINNSIFDKI